MSMSTDTRIALLEEARRHQERWGESVERTLHETSKALQQISQTMAMIAEANRAAEERHDDFKATMSRAFVCLDEHETRLRSIETHMPGLKEVRKWIVAGILAIVVAAATLTWTAITTPPAHQIPKG